MQTFTAEEFSRQPQQLVDDAQRGEPALVTRDGEPVFMAVPLGKGVESSAVRIEFAVSLYDRDQVSLGNAARIAGLSYGEMVDELGRRGLPVARYGTDDLTRELAYVGTLAGR